MTHWYGKIGTERIGDFSEKGVPESYWSGYPENPVNDWVACEPKPTGKGTFHCQADGTWLDVTTPEDKYAELVAVATQLTNDYIQAPITKYNIANGLSFAHVHSCANYINNPDYTHYDFCVDVWNWNVLVWEEARVIQGDVISGAMPQPTPEEFIAMLTPYTGTGA